MPHITVYMYPGTPQGEKQKLAQALKTTLQTTLDVPETAISVRLHEVPPQSWKTDVYAEQIEEQTDELYIAPGYTL